MPKPSEKIEKLFQEILAENPERGRRILSGEEMVKIKCELLAIKKYLDESHCEHKDAYQVDSQMSDIYYNVCNDCGVLFLADQDKEN